MALVLLGCTENPTPQSAVVDRAEDRAPDPPDDVKIPALLAARDPKPSARDDKDGSGATAKDLVEKGKRQANNGDLASSIETFEQAHKLDPKGHEALFFLSLARQIRADGLPEGNDRSAMFLASADAARSLRALSSEPSPQEKERVALAVYNEGRVFAKGNRSEKAIASLKEAADAGFLDVKRMTGDLDLATLRDLPEYKAIVAKVTDARKKAMKAQDDAMSQQLLPEVKKDLASFKSFPFTFELPGLDGKPVKLADYKGKVTIVDIWGTWCPPCRMEVPHFVALRENYKDKGVEIVGINEEHVTASKVKETIEEFAKETGINYTLAIGDNKVEEQIPEFSAFPTTLFLDREGKVRYKHTGYAPYEVIEYVVKTLLDEKGGKPATP